MRKRTEDIERNGVSPPTDTGFASLFDTAYIHPALERSRWPWEYYDKFTWFYSWLTTGAGTGIDQFVGEIQGDRHHARRGRLFVMSQWCLLTHAASAVAMKSNKTQVYISAPYRPKVKSTIEKLRAHMVSLPQSDTKGRQIDVAPWPDYIDADGFVHFQDNGRPEYQVMKHVACKPDIVVYATGYTQVFSFFDGDYPTIFDADICRVWKASVEDVGFIGFVRPSFGMSTLDLMTFGCNVAETNLTSQLGAIPPLAELQAQLWITNLFHRLPRPIQVNENYLLQPDDDRRLDYIVDHETYA